MTKGASAKVGPPGSQYKARLVLHREERHRPRTVVVRAGLVDLGDAGVPEAREQLRLELEPAQGFGRIEPALHDLNRDRAARLVLERLQHGAHAARRDHAPNGVAADAAQRPAGGAPEAAVGASSGEMKVGDGSQSLGTGSPDPFRKMSRARDFGC